MAKTPDTSTSAQDTIPAPTVLETTAAVTPATPEEPVEVVEDDDFSDSSSKETIDSEKKAEEAASDSTIPALVLTTVHKADPDGFGAQIKHLRGEIVHFVKSEFDRLFKHGAVRAATGQEIEAAKDVVPASSAGEKIDQPEIEGKQYNDYKDGVSVESDAKSSTTVNKA